MAAPTPIIQVPMLNAPLASATAAGAMSPDHYTLAAALKTSYDAGGRLRTLPVVGTYGADGPTIDFGVLACDTKGGFRITTTVKVKNAAGGLGKEVSGRVNGSNSTNLTWSTTQRTGTWSYLWGYSTLLNVTGDVVQLTITCVAPSSSLAARTINFSTIHFRPGTGTAWFVTSAQYTGTDELVSVGFYTPEAGALFDGTSSYVIERFT